MKIVEKLREEFNKINTRVKGNGKIRWDKLKHLVHWCDYGDDKISIGMVDRIIERLDIDWTGFIVFEEFIEAYIQAKGEPDKDYYFEKMFLEKGNYNSRELDKEQICKFKEMFMEVDKDGNRTISREELKQQVFDDPEKFCEEEIDY